MQALSIVFILASTIRDHDGYSTIGCGFSQGFYMYKEPLQRVGKENFQYRTRDFDRAINDQELFRGHIASIEVSEDLISPNRRCGVYEFEEGGRKARAELTRVKVVTSDMHEYQLRMTTNDVGVARRLYKGIRTGKAQPIEDWDAEAPKYGRN